ncbi:MAG: hypothetical protein ABWX92_10560 [Mycetocola sp.]
MKVIITIRQEETQRVEAEGPDYVVARRAAEQLVPAGWEIIAYRAER